MTDEIDDLDDAIIEDTVHCSVCAASFVLGDSDPYVVLDPPQDPMKWEESGVRQVKLCPECAEKVVAEVAETEGPKEVPCYLGDAIRLQIIASVNLWVWANLIDGLKQLPTKSRCYIYPRDLALGGPKLMNGSRVRVTLEMVPEKHD